MFLHLVILLAICGHLESAKQTAPVVCQARRDTCLSSAVTQALGYNSTCCTLQLYCRCLAQLCKEYGEVGTPVCYDEFRDRCAPFRQKCSGYNPDTFPANCPRMSLDVLDTCAVKEQTPSSPAAKALKERAEIPTEQPAEHPTEELSIVYIIGGVIAGLVAVALAIVTICCCCCGEDGRVNKRSSSGSKRSVQRGGSRRQSRRSLKQMDDGKTSQMQDLLNKASTNRSKMTMQGTSTGSFNSRAAVTQLQYGNQTNQTARVTVSASKLRKAVM